MNGELSFFMSVSDERNFIELLEKADCELDRSSERVWYIHVEGQRIQFLRCQQCENSISIGRIAVRTAVDVDSKNIAKLYKSLASWIKDNFVNDLTCRNTKTEGSAMRVDSVWVGPSAKAMVEASGTELRQSLNGNVVFEFQA